jgi:hypothetical protein
MHRVGARREVGTKFELFSHSDSAPSDRNPCPAISEARFEFRANFARLRFGVLAVCT